MSDGDGAGVSLELAQEDAARADCYALIGRLFYDAPDSLLLAELCRAPAQSCDADSVLGRAWQALQQACRAAYPAVVKQEFDSLFVGVGKAPVTPYIFHYIDGVAPDRNLLRLRGRLDAWGLARRSAAFEVEDHVSGICDVMRILIMERRSLEEQGRFFNEFAYAGMASFCNAVMGSQHALFYRYVAQFAREFVELEHAAFDMQDAGSSGLT